MEQRLSTEASSRTGGSGKKITEDAIENPVRPLEQTVLHESYEFQDELSSQRVPSAQSKRLLSTPALTFSRTIQLSTFTVPFFYQIYRMLINYTPKFTICL